MGVELLFSLSLLLPQWEDKTEATSFFEGYRVLDHWVVASFEVKVSIILSPDRVIL